MGGGGGAASRDSYPLLGPDHHVVLAVTKQRAPDKQTHGLHRLFEPHRIVPALSVSTLSFSQHRLVGPRTENSPSIDRVRANDGSVSVLKRPLALLPPPPSAPAPAPLRLLQHHVPLLPTQLPPARQMPRGYRDLLRVYVC